MSLDSTDINKLTLWLKKINIANANYYLANYTMSVPLLVKENHTISINDTVVLKQNSKVSFPVLVHNAVSIYVQSKKQGNFDTFPIEIKEILSAEDCDIVSFMGTVKKVKNIDVSNNKIEDLAGLPECEYLDISFNPIKDFSLLKNNVSLKKLSLSLFHLDSKELISTLKDLLNSNVTSIIIKDSFVRSKHREFGLSKDDVSVISNSVDYFLDRKRIESYVLKYDLEKMLPIHHNKKELLKF